MRKKRVFILICTICIFLFLIIWIVESIHISKLVEQTFAMAYESDGQYEMSKYPVIFDENKLHAKFSPYVPLPRSDNASVPAYERIILYIS